MAKRSEDYLENPLPSSEESEQVCLGAVLLDNSCMEINMKFFGPEDLYNPFTRRVYAAMIHLHQSGRQIDPITIGEVLKKEGSLEALGGITRITNLTFGLPHFTAGSLEEFALIIRRMSIKRATIRLCTRVANDMLGNDPNYTEEEILGHLEQKTLQLNAAISNEGTEVPHGFILAQDITPTLREHFEQLHKGIATGISTGMREVDDDLDGGGLQKKGSYLIAGSEKSGKTSLALDWGTHIATVEKKAVLFVTLEMSKEVLLKRIYSAYTGIPYFMFRPGFHDSPTNKAYTRALEGLEEFGKLPFLISDNIFEWTAIKRHVTREVEKGHKQGNTEIGLVVFDYLQLMNVAGIYDTRARVEAVSRGIKQLGSELDVPTLTMSSMNRKQFGDDPNPEPTVDNLRDSGQLGYDAEGIFLLHNPALVPGKPYVPKDITDITLILARQRNGPMGRYNLKFIGKHMEFMTESQFVKHFGTQDVDQNYGGTKQQARLQDDKILNLWDEDDD